MIPHIKFVATEQEIELVIGLDNHEMTIPEIAEKMGMSLIDAEQFVTRAYHRDVLTKIDPSSTDDGPAKYTGSTFYRRLDTLSMYENWGDVPVEARQAVIEWQLQEFINTWGPAIKEMHTNPDARVGVPNRDYLLLDEALEMVDAATEHVLVPCDCRAIVQACDRPLETCVRLDDGARMTLEHGHGRRVSKEEMKQTVIDAHRAGLMQTGNREWKRDGQLFGFCNCCACDCYPIRAGVELGMSDVWPRVHHVAERNLDQCHLCGICTRRCQFDAFYYDGSKIERKGRMRKDVLFDPEKCRGCGVCATACPEGAITMKPLRVNEAVKAT